MTHTVHNLVVLEQWMIMSTLVSANSKTTKQDYLAQDYSVQNAYVRRLSEPTQDKIQSLCTFQLSCGPVFFFH